MPACKENFEVLETVEAHKPSNSRGYGECTLKKREIVIRLIIKAASLALYKMRNWNIYRLTFDTLRITYSIINTSNLTFQRVEMMAFLLLSIS